MIKIAGTNNKTTPDTSAKCQCAPHQDMQIRLKLPSFLLLTIYCSIFSA